MNLLHSSVSDRDHDRLKSGVGKRKKVGFWTYVGWSVLFSIFYFVMCLVWGFGGSYLDTYVFEKIENEALLLLGVLLYLCVTAAVFAWFGYFFPRDTALNRWIMLLTLLPVAIIGVLLWGAGMSRWNGSQDSLSYWNLHNLYTVWALPAHHRLPLFANRMEIMFLVLTLLPSGSAALGIWLQSWRKPKSYS